MPETLLTLMGETTRTGRHFPPTRAEALARLNHFLPIAGRAYASGRNTDPGPDQPSAVSQLSPYVRYRLLTEQEIVTAVLSRHRLEASEKFVQEVLWRTYWKGWLEMRPGIWARFLAERECQRQEFGHARALAEAESGTTGIEGFDDWARELVETGYLHNHARMWFASIWIFTLRLPWALGADFFLRHLIDADAASNTLSWRWVAGLQTPGKTYLATRDNIARYTLGRFAPQGLAGEAVALREAPVDEPRPLRDAPALPPREPALLLVTPEDMHPDSAFAATASFAGAVITRDPALLWGEAARRFTSEAATETAERIGQHFQCTVELIDALDAEVLLAAAERAGVRHIVTPYAPVGLTAEALSRLVRPLASAGVTLTQVRRDWDSRFWPHAKKGFFGFKDRIPAVLKDFGLP